MRLLLRYGLDADLNGANMLSDRGHQVIIRVALLG
jgi:hypothetical protein